MKRKQIVSPSFIEFCTQLQEAILEGYSIQQDAPPTAWVMGLYDAELIREDEDHKIAEVFIPSVITELEKAKPGRIAKGGK